MAMAMLHPLLHHQIDNMICVVHTITIIGEEIMVEGTGIIFARIVFPGKIVMVVVEAVVAEI